MNASTATARQIGLIHGLAKRAGMDEDTRRDFLERETGQRSCKEISQAQAAGVIDQLRARTSLSVRGLDTPLAKKLRALWIAGFNLGLVHDRHDGAMLAFVERQTGVSHTRFLAEPGAGRAAVEGLKAWLARDGGVVWPSDRDASLLPPHILMKRAVVMALWQRILALGIVAEGAPIEDPELRAFSVAAANGWDLQTPGDYDSVGNVLGRLVRRAKGAGR